MPLESGTRLGPYQISHLLGAGGMGEVYRATDTRLDRSVAIKVLPERLASNLERRERFEREARAVSSLNHPHICTLHDVGVQGGTHYLVMELVEGETLEARLAKGRLPVTRVLEYAGQIADALDKAHRSGVVHRDLKPANIMLTPAGVKLLDFGLAKLTGEGGPVSGMSQAATRAQKITGEGVIVGTLHYMAPEQLEGLEVDARADIFSFGSIVYEMLSGKRAFDGESAAGVMASILKAEPLPLSASEPVPSALEHLVRTCLEKKREDRWQTAHDVARQLEWLRSSPAAVAAPPASGKGRSGVWVRSAVIALAALALGAGLMTYFSRSSSPGQPARLKVSLPDGIRFSVGEDFSRSAVISPDGQHIVFTGLDQASGNAFLYLRPIGAENATALQGTEDGNSIFWSPDSTSVGFFAEGKLLTMKIQGGTPREIARSSSVGGATWNRKNVILASLKNPGPIFNVPADGGAPTPVTSFDPSTETDHRWPQFLDDDDHFLYLAAGRTAADNKVIVGSLSSPDRTTLMTGVSAFTYASPNHLIFLRDGTLMAQTFDDRGFVLIGAPWPLEKNVVSPFSASRTGAVTYRTIPPTPNPLLWIGIDGSPAGTAMAPGYYTDPVISPDGTEIAYATRESIGARWHVSILNLASGISQRLTVGDATARAPVFSPDGKAIVYLSLRSDAPGMYRKNANGVGDERRIHPFPGVLWPYQWYGEHLFYFAGVSGANDVWMLNTADTNTPTPLIQSPANDVDGAVSPDGKWFIYSSNETGRWEIYVTTFPVSSTKLPVTTRGGTDPLWSRDGKKLFYVKPASAELISVEVTPGNPPQFGAHKRIYAGPLEYPTAHSYAVDPRADRILVAPSVTPQGDITVLLNWKSLPTN